MYLAERWYESRLRPGLALLAPLAGLFAGAAALRRRLYRRGALPCRRLPVPVGVVGNLTAGGAGKTPLTLWLARELLRRGRQPGIVSRGYGGSAAGPLAVAAGATAAEVGDEPLLLANKSGVPVWIGRDRAAAGSALLAAHPAVDLVLCDDGLQHYRLARDVEIAVFDGRGAGNGWPLPAGPLREPLARLAAVDAVVFNGRRDGRVVEAAAGIDHFDMALRPGAFYRLGDPGSLCTAADLAGRPLHALAGIGHPGRFFRTLADLGLEFTAHPFPDHHAYGAADLAFAAGGVLLMTEKDAVKCKTLATGETWVLPVEAEVSSALIDLILEKIRGRQAS